jgi:hypothetical protein
VCGLAAAFSLFLSVQRLRVAEGGCKARRGDPESCRTPGVPIAECDSIEFTREFRGTAYSGV